MRSSQVICVVGIAVGIVVGAQAVDSRRAQGGSGPAVIVDPSCAQDNPEQISGAARTALLIGAGCLKAIENPNASGFAAMSDAQTVVACSEAPDPKQSLNKQPCASDEAVTTVGPNGKSILTLTLYPGAFKNPGCGPLASTIFHELLHHLVPDHRAGDCDKQDPGDVIDNCEQTCFPWREHPATSQTCAACNGAKNGQGDKCSRYRFVECPASGFPASFDNSKCPSVDPTKLSTPCYPPPAPPPPPTVPGDLVCKPPDPEIVYHMEFVERKAVRKPGCGLGYIYCCYQWEGRGSGPVAGCQPPTMPCPNFPKQGKH
jgi:hypothetical protein